MKVYPSAAACCPDADQTVETSVLERIISGPSDLWARRGHPHVRKRAKRIWHRYGDTWRWHWSDQDMTHLHQES